MIFSFVNTSIGQGIEFFHGTWAEAKAKSKESGKLIFVDAYTSWCDCMQEDGSQYISFT
jgi:hypothetical protein